MIRFEDGPAAGKALDLRRCPLFLRVCIAADGSADALDQLDDEPRADETLHAYRREGEVGQVHVQMSGPGGRGRRCHWMLSARYRLYMEQPPDDLMRDRGRWQEWCKEQYEKENA